VKSTWDESMTTGNDLIDRQHREVVHLLDELRASHLSTPERGRRALDDLMTFVATHFIAEEHLMNHVDYPAAQADEMIRDHAQFTDYARLRVLEFRVGNHATLLPLAAYLYDWLTVHEFGMDRLLADWINTQTTGESEARSPSASTARTAIQ